MSLFEQVEICDECMHAEWHSCGNCLKSCAINAQDKCNYCHGECDGFVIKESNEIERITHAAIIIKDGSIEIGKSHADIIKKCPFGSCVGNDVWQGFVTSTGRYVDRLAALRIAIEAEQVDKDSDCIRNLGLLSENIWSDTAHEYDADKGYFIPESEAQGEIP